MLFENEKQKTRWYINNLYKGIIRNRNISKQYSSQRM